MKWFDWLNERVEWRSVGYLALIVAGAWAWFALLPWLIGR